MKKIVISFLLISMPVLGGCFGSSDSTDNSTTSQNLYKTSEYQINTPPDWEVFTKNTFTSDVPQNTELILRSKNKNEVFIANVNVTKNIVADSISAEDYAKKMLQSSGVFFVNFKKIDEKKVGSGYTIIYQGKENAGDPLLEFVQHVTAKDQKIWIATAAYNPADAEQTRTQAQDIANSLQAL